MFLTPFPKKLDSQSRPQQSYLCVRSRELAVNNPRYLRGQIFSSILVCNSRRVKKLFESSCLKCLTFRYLSDTFTIPLRKKQRVVVNSLISTSFAISEALVKKMIVWFDLHFKVYFCPNCQIFIDEFIFCFEQSLCVFHVKITCEDSFSTEKFQFSAILGQKKNSIFSCFSHPNTYLSK